MIAKDISLLHKVDSTQQKNELYCISNEEDAPRIEPRDAESREHSIAFI